MKRFENANIEIISFNATDIISTSLLAGNRPGMGEDDEIPYN